MKKSLISILRLHRFGCHSREGGNLGPSRTFWIPSRGTPLFMGFAGMTMLFFCLTAFAFDTQKISINTANEKISLTVEMAVTPSERALGLMYRKEMPANHGMLFVFDFEGAHSFWMKNTVLSLDILFLDSHKKIVFIAENAKPFSEDLISPPMPTAYALEVNAGFAKAHHIAVGQKVDFINPSP